MQTPLEQFIEEVEKQITDCNALQQREKGALLYCKNFAKSLLAEERKVIESSYNVGASDYGDNLVCAIEDKVDNTGEHYFKANFTTK